MKYLTKIPFIRIWANLFVFDGKENSKDYDVDYILYFISAILVSVLSFVLFRTIYTENVLYSILILINFLIYLRLPLLAMSARRFRDSENSWKLCFLILIPLGFIWAPFVCLRLKTKEEMGFGVYQYNKRVLRTPSIIIGVISAITFPYILVIYGFLFIDIPLSSSDYESSFDIAQYETYRSKIKYAEEGLPTLEELGDYENAVFAYRNVVYSYIVGFESQTISLFVDYNEEKYVDAKQYIDARYVFITEPIVQDDGDYTFPVASFDYKGYEFKISYTSASEYSSGSVYPKSFTMVGFDETNNSIALLYYYDMDLDLLGDKNATEDKRKERMPKLIEQAFYWRQDQ